MSNIYLKSKDVQVFPASYRGTVDGVTLFNPESRIPNEYNLSDIKILDYILWNSR